MPLLFLVLLQCVPDIVVGDGGMVVSRVSTTLSEGNYYLHIQVDYSLSETALEALDNGVPLTLAMRIQVRAKGAWIWERSLVDLTQLSMIHYKPLSDLYGVTHLPHGPRRSFVTRAAAIAALGEVEDLPLVEHSQLDPKEQYFIHVKVSLDIEALPLPLRPTAYLTPSWNLSSGWTKWPLTP